MTNGYHQPGIEIRVFLYLDRLPSKAYETHLPVTLVVLPGASRCPVTIYYHGEELHRTCCGEAMYWQRETDALASHFRISASQLH